MKKKLLIFFIFLSFFSFFCLSITPVLAQTPINNTNFSQAPNTPSDNIDNPGSVLGIAEVIDTIWSWLAKTYETCINFITNLPFISIPKPTTVDTREKNNDYEQDSKNINTRAMPEKILKYQKGVWFYEILSTDKYHLNDQLIESINQTDCPIYMRIADVIYFYYVNQNKYPKILYQRGQMDTPIDYPSAIGALNVTLNYPDDCYINAYNNIPNVPIGWFKIGADKQEAASLLSTQLNESIRTIISNNAQGESAPPDVNDEIQARLIAEDTDKQEKSMLLHLIPEEQQKTIPCGDNSTKNRNYLRIAYANMLYPELWPHNPYNSGTTMDGLTITEGGTPNENETASMSQHGGHGMSLSGYDYKQILSAYFGDVTTTLKEEDKKDANLIISVFVQTLYNGDSFNSCEKLRSGKKFMPNIEAGEGGFKLVSKDPKVIEECSKENGDYVPILETYIDPFTNETKTRPTGKWQEKIKDTCRGFIKDLNLVDYLFGIAETPVSWHIEYQKAHIIVCRQHGLDSKSGTATRTNGENLGEWVYNNANTQAFRCDQANAGVGSTSNLVVAVKLTDREYTIYKNDGKTVPVSERSLFGRQQIKPPFFDGTIFENLSMVKFSGRYDSVTGICFKGIKNTLDDDNNPQIADTSNQSPIIKKYDLATVDNGKWLETYPGNSQTGVNTQVLGIQSYSDKCYLDSRIFPSLNSLITSLGQDISDNQIIFNSCYRSLTDQNKLWINALKKWGNQAEAMKHINKPGESPHHTGRAIDFADKNGKLNTSSSVYQWLVKNGSRFGFYNYQLEPEHWVYNP